MAANQKPVNNSRDLSVPIRDQRGGMGMAVRGQAPEPSFELLYSMNDDDD